MTLPKWQHSDDMLLINIAKIVKVSLGQDLSSPPDVARTSRGELALKLRGKADTVNILRERFCP